MIQMTRASTLWVPGTGETNFAFGGSKLLTLISRVREQVHIIRDIQAGGMLGIGYGGSVEQGSTSRYEWVGSLPPLYPEWLGDRSFGETHGCRFPYVVGEMARGISSVRLVVAAAETGLLGFFGSAGLNLETVEASLVKLRESLADRGLPYGANLIHSPQEPDLEEALVDLFLRLGVRNVSASAFMSVTASVVRYACSGLRITGGRIERQNRLFAKVSRPEVARHFMSPPPAKLLARLVETGRITSEEARLSEQLPLAEDITVEADSGGHTDNRPLPVLLPAIGLLRDELMQRNRYEGIAIRIGAAGGLGTPDSVAAAFAMGAAYVMTGTVNQAAVESGLSDDGKRILSGVGLADTAMAPSSDMFELGAKVQVVRRGSMYPARAARLYDLYNRYDSIQEIPDDVRQQLEQELFHAPLEQIWEETKHYFEKRDPAQLARALQNGKHQMALVFRWYLGKSSRWPIEGISERISDYQIWCGPVMGAFNAWTSGTFMGKPENRHAGQIALNLLEGASVITRVQQFRSYGIAVPQEAFRFRPRPLKLGGAL